MLLLWFAWSGAAAKDFGTWDEESTLTGCLSCYLRLKSTFVTGLGIFMVVEVSYDCRLLPEFGRELS